MLRTFRQKLISVFFVLQSVNFFPEHKYFVLGSQGILKHAIRSDSEIVEENDSSFFDRKWGGGSGSHQVFWQQCFMNLSSFHICYMLSPTDRPWFVKSNDIYWQYVYFIGWRSANSRVRKPFSSNVFGFLTPEDGTNRLSQNIRKKLLLLAV
jgi:hypothetical protein